MGVSGWGTASGISTILVQHGWFKPTISKRRKRQSLRQRASASHAVQAELVAVGFPVKYTFAQEQIEGIGGGGEV
jgi:hypothetical protein